MTTGNTFKQTEIHSSTSWYQTGYSNCRDIHQRIWNGGDGKPGVNAYDGTHLIRTGGYCYGAIDFGPTGCGTQPVAAFIVTHYPSRPTGVTAQADQAAMSNLIDKILGHEFQANVSLAESYETVKYLVQRLTPLVKAFKYFKDGDMYRARKALGLHKPLRLHDYQSAASWLEIRYAIMPIVYDVNNAMGYLDRELGKPQTAKVEAFSRYNISGPWPDPGDLRSSYYWPNIKQVQYSRVGLTLKEGFDYQAIDWKNPYTPAWEVTPFSFVIDWVIPIGDFLRNRWFFKYSEFSDGYHTRLLKCDSGHLASNTLHHDKFPAKCGRDESELLRARERFIHMTRVNFNGDTVPLPTVRNPVSETAHWKRAADLVALLASRGRASSVRFALN